MKAGDLIEIPLGAAGVATGHVLLNVASKSTKQQLAARSRLREHGDLLLDIWRDSQCTARLIHGVWIDAEPRGKSRWAVIGARPVVAEDVEFPEYVVNVSGEAMFERGEIMIPLPGFSNRVDVVHTSQPFITYPALPRICMNLIGRRDLNGEDAILFDRKPRTDLRLDPHRAEVYRELGVDPNRTYWDWASAQNLDPGRLWR
jgi:hypothetical protein